MGLRLLKPDKTTGTSVDTIEVTAEVIREWKLPPFQRPLRANAKVLALAEELKHNEGVFPGILTIGILKGAKYLVDGQHRCHAFEISELQEGYTDVRYRYYQSMDEMAEDFVRLNSTLVRMRPDDILRGLEGTSQALQMIRKACPFVGYDHVRRNANAPILSMSALLRCWFVAGRAVPSGGGTTAMDMARTLTTDDAEQITDFLNIALKAWGRDPEYARLWASLNLTLSMWVYRHVSLRTYSAKSPRITKDMFGKLLASLSAATDYLEWLLGRQLSERDRSPCYRRLKAIFVKRLEAELGRKVNFPQPEWVLS